MNIQPSNRMELRPSPVTKALAALFLSLWMVGASAAQDEGEPAGTSDPLQAVLEVSKTNDPAEEARDQQQRRQEQLARQQREQQLGAEHARAEEEYRRTRSEYEMLLKQHPQIEHKRTMLEQQLRGLENHRNSLAQQMAALQAAELATRRQHQQNRNRPLPQDGTFKVFSLRNSRAADVARIFSEILPDAATRMAVDERTNSLLVFADEHIIEIVEALTLKLDERDGETAVEKAQPGETLQLRIVWLLDIDEGIAPTDKFVAPQVVEALHELGFSDPKVVCQQVMTLTLSDDGGRRGHFNFDVPVLVKSHQWQLEGQGQIESMADKRFNVPFEMRFHYGDNHRGQLGGSIYTPLGHYTVMGTTTFVRTDWDDRDVQQVPAQRQHLSAFVVYLDRAREFPASPAPSNNRTDIRR